MEIHFSPELQNRLNDAAKAVGCAADEFVQKIVATYVTDTKMGAVGTHHNRHSAALAILDLQKNVVPDPEGLTIRDYLNHGRR